MQNMLNLYCIFCLPSLSESNRAMKYNTVPVNQININATVCKKVQKFCEILKYIHNFSFKSVLR